MKHWAFFLLLMGVVLPGAEADSESAAKKHEGIADQPKKDAAGCFHPAAGRLQPTGNLQ